jgi:hypothetical protein
VIVTRWPWPPTIVAALTPLTSSRSGIDAGLELRLDRLLVAVAGDGERDDGQIVDREDHVGFDAGGQRRRCS